MTAETPVLGRDVADPALPAAVPEAAYTQSLAPEAYASTWSSVPQTVACGTRS